MSKWAFQILASLTLLTTVAVGTGRPQEEPARGDELAGPSDEPGSRIVIPEPKPAADAQSTQRTRIPAASPFANAKPAADAKPAANSKPAAAAPFDRAAVSSVDPQRAKVSIVDDEPASVVAAHRVTPVSGQKELPVEKERISLASGQRARAAAAESVAPPPPPAPAPAPQASASPSDASAQPAPGPEPCEEDDCCPGRVCTCPLCGACNMPQHYAYLPAMHGYYYFRPYHHSHIAKHQQIAASWGADPRFPYSNEIFKTVYAQYRKDRAQPAAPKATERP